MQIPTDIQIVLYILMLWDEISRAYMYLLELINVFRQLSGYLMKHKSCQFKVKYPISI